jgi:pyocin large subunit-like protein
MTDLEIAAKQRRFWGAGGTFPTHFKDKTQARHKNENDTLE